MSDGVNIKLNGVAIKPPTDLQFNDYNVTKAGRVASGTMKMDLIAQKRKFEISYSVLAGKDLQTILPILKTKSLMFTIEYTDTDDGERKTAKVYVGEVQRKRFRSDEFGWYWKDVKFNLIEQ